MAGLPSAARAHRALADAEMAAHLTLYLERELMRRFALKSVTHALLGRIEKASKGALQSCVARSAVLDGSPERTDRPPLAETPDTTRHQRRNR